MANYIETARSNYFKVKDLTAFEDAIAPYGGFTIHHGEVGTDREGMLCILADESFPDFAWDDETGEQSEKEFYQIVAEHLTEDSVFVAVGSGYEKMRYVTGWAYAVDSTGGLVTVNIYEIYQKAKKKFKGKTVTLAEY